jgi:polar amino acid transport system permease protein/putative glutamine transport system permease protein
MALDFGLIFDNWQLFAYGALITIVLSAVSLAIAFCLAVPIALMALSKSASLRAIAAVYLEFFRNLPFIVILYIFFYGLPGAGIRLPDAVVGVTALSFFASSYLSEVVRGAILSVPLGQMEAARAIGLSYLQGLKDIVAPQTLKFLIPPATSTSISAIKETSVLSVVTVGEITYQGLIVQGNTFAPFEVFITTAMLYWAITAAFSKIMRRYEKSMTNTQGSGRGRVSLADRFLKIEM